MKFESNPLIRWWWEILPINQIRTTCLAIKQYTCENDISCITLENIWFIVLDTGICIVLDLVITILQGHYQFLTYKQLRTWLNSHKMYSVNWHSYISEKINSRLAFSKLKYAGNSLHSRLFFSVLTVKPNLKFLM